MPELYPEDQEKVNQYLKENVNSVERKPFRPLVLLGVIIICLIGITVLGIQLSKDHGVL